MGGQENGMDFFEVTRSRLSYRGRFLDQPVPREDLIKIVQAGLDAPSGKNMQTTEFMVVDNREIIKEIQAMPEGNKAMTGGKAYILCLVDKEKEASYEGMNFQLEDCAAAVENMLLALTALGYAGVWIDGWLHVQKRGEILAKIVGAPSNKMIQVVIPLGIPAKELSTIPRVPKKSMEERVTFI
jgi:nitroreductase